MYFILIFIDLLWTNSDDKIRAVAALLDLLQGK